MSNQNPYGKYQHTINLRTLRNEMRSKLTLEQLYSICVDLGVSPEDIAGHGTRGGLCLGIFDYAKRHTKIPKLIEVLHTSTPGLSLESMGGPPPYIPIWPLLASYCLVEGGNIFLGLDGLFRRWVPMAGVLLSDWESASTHDILHLMLGSFIKHGYPDKVAEFLLKYHIDWNEEAQHTFDLSYYHWQVNREVTPPQEVAYLFGSTHSRLGGEHVPESSDNPRSLVAVLHFYASGGNDGGILAQSLINKLDKLLIEEYLN